MPSRESPGAVSRRPCRSQRRVKVCGVAVWSMTGNLSVSDAVEFVAVNTAHCHCTTVLLCTPTGSRALCLPAAALETLTCAWDDRVAVTAWQPATFVTFVATGCAAAAYLPVKPTAVGIVGDGAASSAPHSVSSSTCGSDDGDEDGGGSDCVSPVQTSDDEDLFLQLMLARVYLFVAPIPSAVGYAHGWHTQFPFNQNSEVFNGLGCTLYSLLGGVRLSFPITSLSCLWERV
jgi:hypothetical protein